MQGDEAGVIRRKRGMGEAREEFAGSGIGTDTGTEQTDLVGCTKAWHSLGVRKWRDLGQGDGAGARNIDMGCVCAILYNKPTITRSLGRSRRNRGSEEEHSDKTRTQMERSEPGMTGEAGLVMREKEGPTGVSV